MNLDLFKEIDSSFVCLHNKDAVSAVQSISTPYAPRENTFVFIKGKKFLSKILEQTPLKSFGVIFCEKYLKDVGEEAFEELKKNKYWIGSVSHFDRAICSYSQYFYQKKRGDYNLVLDGRIDGSAQVSSFAQIGQNVFIGENVIIQDEVTLLPGSVIQANSIIGEGSTIHSNVVIYPDTVIGKNCVIHSGTTIGTDGFGYNFIDGKHEKIWHFAGVQISDDVEIGSNSCVDQGTFSPTTIGRGTKIDNFCQVSHNCRIGEFCIMCGRSGCSGSVTVEDYVIFGAGAGVGPSAHIKKGAKLAAISTVSENAIVQAGETVAGHPAVPLNKWLRTQAKVRRL
jgi:UDP-3-O-[3-hydroxymyristoyl] glucosamine N-acyltransferase